MPKPGIRPVAGSKPLFAGFLVLVTFFCVSCDVNHTSRSSSTPSGKKASQKQGPLKYYFSVSPDGHTILYSWNGSIYTAALDASGIRRLTTAPEGYTHYGAEFSRDGSKILYLSGNDNLAPNGPTELYVMEAGGSSPQKVMTDEGALIRAVFSADGGSVYFIRSGEFKRYSPVGKPAHHKLDLFSVNVDGSDRRQLTFWDAYSMSSLELSPDGKEIFVRRTVSVPDPAKVAKWTEKDDENLDKYIAKQAKQPDSPEKKAELRESMKRRRLSMIADQLTAVSSEDPTKVRTVAKDASSDDTRRFSPDGMFIVYRGLSDKRGPNASYAYELFLRDLATGETKMLTHLGHNVLFFRFIDGGKKLLCTVDVAWATERRQKRDIQLMSVSLDGAPPQLIDLDPTKTTKFAPVAQMDRAQVS